MKHPLQPKNGQKCVEMSQKEWHIYTRTSLFIGEKIPLEHNYNDAIVGYLWANKTLSLSLLFSEFVGSNLMYTY